MAQYGYVAHFFGQKKEFYADSLYAAKQEAVKQFHPAKSKVGYLSVMLAEVDGVAVVHKAVD